MEGDPQAFDLDQRACGHLLPAMAASIPRVDDVAIG